MEGSGARPSACTNQSGRVRRQRDSWRLVRGRGAPASVESPRSVAVIVDPSCDPDIVVREALREAGEDGRVPFTIIGVPRTPPFLFAYASLVPVDCGFPARTFEECCLRDAADVACAVALRFPLEYACGHRACSGCHDATLLEPIRAGHFDSVILGSKACRRAAWCLGRAVRQGDARLVLLSTGSGQTEECRSRRRVAA